MKPFMHLLIVCLIGCNIAAPLFADNKNELLSDTTFSGLKLRGVGPAFMSGRIADIAINPQNYSQWYIAVGSGNVWKTNNAGTTWKPIFDDQSSYSIGCITIDPSDTTVIWVGTGENVGGRHVGYGDGIYRSIDAGATWENMGLKNSEHISKIIIHPNNSDVIWVAAQGPLWSKGGDRGLYKSTSGGKKWKKILGDDQWVGVTDIIIDPRNPDQLYAATWQRHRNVAAYMGGGPGTAIYSSGDGGENWIKLSKGLPNSNMGKIGLAISSQKPDVIYAAIELDRRTGGVYRSINKGISWTKMSDAVGGGTGPHYYQELYASPHKFDRIYLADVFMQVSEDGGKTFSRIPEKFKHVDNHALAFRADDPNYLLAGCDGGLYESFDLAANWRFIANLPVTQFYKVAVDDAEPFYNIYGGTQDNSTQGGPSRTVWSHGIENGDWFLTIGGDGHQPATEPGNPDIVYSESQRGFMSRVDVTTGEIVLIQPQPGSGEDYERFNWDTPIIVSPHLSTRIYLASHRVWRSDNRGDSWTAISGDLTRNQERINLPIMGQSWSWDSSWDFVAMSTYNTITSLAESPKQEGLIYAGMDDGLIQVTENGGVLWRRIEVGDLPGVPKTAFVNDIKSDLFDANTVYIALDNHKFGDFKPYLLKSTDRGNNWKSINGNIPKRNLVWRVVQDHVNPGLLFAATEFGVYFTLNGGNKWIKLIGDVPTISFRDLAIQRRENDLVGATFGRGFYIFDDYSVLRHVSKEQLSKEATLFPVRDTGWYIERQLGVIGGASHYTAPNPPFGAVFTYYLKDAIQTKKEMRQKNEKDKISKKQMVKFPGWEKVEEERRQQKPLIWLTVTNKAGQVVRRVKGINKKGFHRVAWDLRFPPTDAIATQKDLEATYVGAMVSPGTYTVQLSKQIDGHITNLSDPTTFKVVKLFEGTLAAAGTAEVAAFWREAELLNRSVTAASKAIEKALARTDLLQKTADRLTTAPGAIDSELHQLHQSLLELDEKLSGNRSKRQVGESTTPTIAGRLSASYFGTSNSSYGPTPNLKNNIDIAAAEFRTLKTELDRLIATEIPRLEKLLYDAGAPWIDGQEIPDY